MSSLPASGPKLRAAALALGLLMVLAAHAQHPGGGPPGGGPGGGVGGGMGGPPPPPRSPGALHGELQIAPPGRWWDDHQFAKELGIDKNQRQRMDDIFKQNRGPLLQSYRNLQHQEAELEKLARAKNLDEAAIDQQIDRVSQARGELEKANAHMLIEIRKEMNAEQNARLDERRSPPPPSEDE